MIQWYFRKKNEHIEGQIMDAGRAIIDYVDKSFERGAELLIIMTVQDITKMYWMKRLWQGQLVWFRIVGVRENILAWMHVVKITYKFLFPHYSSIHLRHSFLRMSIRIASRYYEIFTRLEWKSSNTFCICILVPHWLIVGLQLCRVRLPTPYSADHTYEIYKNNKNI